MNKWEDRALDRAFKKRGYTSDDVFDELFSGRYLKVSDKPAITKENFPDVPEADIFVANEKVLTKQNNIRDTEKGPQAIMAEYIVRKVFEDFITPPFIFTDRYISVIPSSEYDELFLGKDIILWFEPTSTNKEMQDVKRDVSTLPSLYLGIDVTIAPPNSERYENKNQKIEKNIRKYGQGLAKFFVNKEKLEEKRGFVLMPEIALYLDSETLVKARDLMVFLGENNVVNYSKLSNKAINLMNEVGQTIVQSVLKNIRSTIEAIKVELLRTSSKQKEKLAYLKNGLQQYQALEYEFKIMKPIPLKKEEASAENKKIA